MGRPLLRAAPCSRGQKMPRLVLLFREGKSVARYSSSRGGGARRAAVLTGWEQEVMWWWRDENLRCFTAPLLFSTLGACD